MPKAAQIPETILKKRAANERRASEAATTQAANKTVRQTLARARQRQQSAAVSQNQKGLRQLRSPSGPANRAARYAATSFLRAWD